MCSIIGATFFFWRTLSRTFDFGMAADYYTIGP